MPEAPATCRRSASLADDVKYSAPPAMMPADHYWLALEKISFLIRARIKNAGRIHTLRTEASGIDHASDLHGIFQESRFSSPWRLHHHAAAFIGVRCSYLIPAIFTRELWFHA